tara:strand:- start:98 stop:256 length:159 start_codon:yes stop_codon:yes gene_type:complete
MSEEREKGRKWDGKSRVSTEQYKKNWNEIFKKKEPKTRLEQMEQLEHDPIID